MVEFETINFKTIPFGKRNFIEVARKKAVGGSRGETEFISLSRGYFKQDDTKQFQKGKSITLPLDENVRKEIAQHLMEI
ncbi:MAG: hypothetical protein MUC62_06915 [Candidatus Thermoplasmatota archaeon]|jgi:hypothetical protein|nr:hypothetical protein [Candidatus Thermoplasmatota archaeon]